MSHTPLRISVIVVNFNYAPYLAMAIDSALQQSCTPFEIIVVDDGSTDQSPDLIRSYGNRIIPVWKENGGQTSACCSGFAASSGDAILFLDSDDYLHPDCLRQLALLWRPDTSKIHFPLQMVNVKGQLIPGLIPRIYHRKHINQTALRFGSYHSPPSSGNLYARSFLLKILPYHHPDLINTADTFPIAAAPFFGHVCGTEHPLGFHRIHHQASASLSGNSGTGINQSQNPAWLRSVVRRNQAAYALVKCALSRNQILPHPVIPPFQKAPSMLRYHAYLVKSSPKPRPLPKTPEQDFVAITPLCLAGLESSITFPGYSPRDRLLLLCWFLFLWLTPKPLFLLLLHLGLLKVSGNPPGHSLMPKSPQP